MHGEMDETLRYNQRAMGYIWWLIFIPVLDIVLLTRIGVRLGGAGLLVWLGAAAILGFLAIRTQGFRIWPGRSAPPLGLLERVLIIVAGLLLVFPGPLSDVLGIVLLVPPLRRKILERLKNNLLARWISESQGARFSMWGFGRPPGPFAGEDGATGAGDAGAPREKEKTGRSRGEFPGAARARDVEFEEVDRKDPEDRAS